MVMCDGLVVLRPAFTQLHTVQYFSGGECILQGRICFTGVNIIYRGEYSEYFVQERIYFTLEKIIFCFSFRPVTESSNVYYATVCYYLLLFLSL